jgi:hypothetical protein
MGRLSKKSPPEVKSNYLPVLCNCLAKEQKKMKRKMKENQIAYIDSPKAHQPEISN